MRRLAILSTHPIQYNAPLFRMLHDEDGLDVHVFFSKTWDQVKYDPDFQREVTWDIPVSEGYPHSTHDASTRLGQQALARPSAFPTRRPARLRVELSRALRHHAAVPWARSDLVSRRQPLVESMPFWKKAIKRAMLTWVYRHVDAAFTVGTANEDYYRWSGLKESRLIRAPHSVDIDYWNSDHLKRSNEAVTWRQELSIPPDARVVGFAGKVEPIKQVDMIIKSTLDSGPRHHVVIAGTGPLEAEFKDRFTGNPRVHFLGFVNQSRMPIFYRLIDLLALASSSETWGLCINEAMACGTPCIVSNRTGCSLDMFECPDHGVIVNWNDAASWTSAIRTQLETKTKNIDWSNIHANFHPQRFVDALHHEFMNPAH